MSSYNRVVLMGHLVKSPELRFLPGGKTAICEVGLAVNERFTKEGEIVESVSFFDIVFWGRTAEVVNEYLTKGSLVLIEGRLKQDTWEKEGEKRSKVKVVCEKMQMIGGKKAEQQSVADPATNEEAEVVGVGAKDQDDKFQSIYEGFPVQLHSAGPS